MKDTAFEKLLEYIIQEEERGVTNPFPPSFKPTDYSTSILILEAAADNNVISQKEFLSAKELLRFAEKRILLYKILARRNTKDMKELGASLKRLLENNLHFIRAICELDELKDIPEVQ